MAATTDVIKIEDIERLYTELKDKFESMDVTSDEEYEQVCEFARRIKATEKEVDETEEVQEKKRLKKEADKYQKLESAVKKKLSEIERISKAHIASYVVRRSQEAIDEQTEKAIQAAIATGDDSLLDMVLPSLNKAPEVPGVTFAEITDFTIEDPEAIPDKYKSPDTSAIRKVVQALGTEAEIPGVRVIKKKQVRVSAA